MRGALLGGSPTAALVLLNCQMAAADPAPAVSDTALRAAVVDLRPADAVLTLTLTTTNTDGSLTDAASSGQRVVTLAADVLFAFGSADLTPAATSRLDQAAAAVKGSGNTVAVDGYTDSVGDPASNLVLSQRRAAAVLATLRPQLGAVTFSVTGRGEVDPVAPNTNPDGSDSPAGRAANRRVTLTATSSR